MIAHISDKTKGIIMGFGGFFAFSLSDALGKYLAGNGFSAAQISCLYALTAIFLLLLFSKKLGGIKAALATQHKKTHLLRAILQAPTQALNIYGFYHMPLANGYAILFLMPFLTALMGIPLLNERPHKSIWLIIILGFAGILIAMRPDIYGFTPPVIALFISAIFGATRQILVRKMPGESAFSLAFYPTLAIAVATAIPTILHFAPYQNMDFTLNVAGGALFAAGILMTSVAFRYARAATIAPTHYSQLIWAIAIGALFFADMPDIWTLVGLAIIALSGMALIRAKD